MYVILVYDCGKKRVNKMLKLCRQYLNWIQNSVFEGEISEVKLKELTLKAKDFMEMDEDSLIIFSGRTEKWLDKQIVGKERSSIENFLLLIVEARRMYVLMAYSLKQIIFDVLKASCLDELSMISVFCIFAHRQLFCILFINLIRYILLIINVSF
jgi:CRISPR-associated protein Cas2